MPNGTSIVNMGDLTKPANTLIEKIAGALQGYFKPYQIKRVAKAEAEADIVRAQARIRTTNLQRRALARFVVEETKKQDNMEEITRKAIPHLETSSTPEKMDDDWITNFFDKCRIISDAEMQSLWSRVLAGEANAPGAYSKRTVNLLASLDKTDAELFTALCRFVWSLPVMEPLVFDYLDPIYRNHGVTFDSLNHLDDIGLISLDTVISFNGIHLPQRVAVGYHKVQVVVEFTKPTDNDLPIGATIFTTTGRQLFRICNAQPIDGFVDYVMQRWSKNGLAVSISPPPQPTTS